MSRLFLVVVCLSCLTHGRRIQTPMARVQHNLEVAKSNEVQPCALWGVTTISSHAQYLRLNAGIAFIPSVPRGIQCIGNVASATSKRSPSFHHHVLVMKAGTASTLERGVPADQLQPCPSVILGERIPDIRQAQTQARSETRRDFPQVVQKSDVMPASVSEEAELAWLSSHAQQIRDDMVQHGALVFRGFALMKEPRGFETFYRALGMHTCQDPLYSARRGRANVDGSDNPATYEAVNDDNLKNFFLGMHNEFLGEQAPRAGAFVCFKPADIGGEFFLADGRAVFCDLDSDVLERIYRRSIRYSEFELDEFEWVDNLPKPLQSPIMSYIKGMASLTLHPLIFASWDFDVDLVAHRNSWDKGFTLSARTPSLPPVLCHPITGKPSWFCNVHTCSSRLRRAREGMYGPESPDVEERLTTDIFYGDDGEISDDDLKHFDEVTRQNMHYLKMTEGDVVLLDNYQAMHGRNRFNGTRKHAVAWFGGWDGQE